MIRMAKKKDLDFIEEEYKEHFANEKENIAFTVFQDGVYPTRKDAEEALRKNALYVCEEKGVIVGSMIFDGQQPDEYKKINWKSRSIPEKVKVIHLLMVPPRFAGRGIGYKLINYAVDIAKQESCEVIRLDTGEQNIPACNLYKKAGFELAGTSSMKVGNAISHNRHSFFEKRL